MLRPPVLLLALARESPVSKFLVHLSHMVINGGVPLVVALFCFPRVFFSQLSSTDIIYLL